MLFYRPLFSIACIVYVREPKRLNTIRLGFGSVGKTLATVRSANKCRHSYVPNDRVPGSDYRSLRVTCTWLQEIRKRKINTTYLIANAAEYFTDQRYLLRSLQIPKEQNPLTVRSFLLHIPNPFRRPWLGGEFRANVICDLL